VHYGGSAYTMGVLVQANFGSRRELTISGVPLGAALGDDNPMEGFFSAAGGAGSIVAIVATDAPLLPNQCKALARRVTLGVARTGTSGSHYSGDLFLTLSTANAGAFSNAFGPLFEDYEERLHDLHFIPWGFLDRFFEAVVQAVEEAVVNALVANEEMHGFGGRRVPGLPREQVVELLQARGVIT
jgi:L-aminopeptidase/D-esterase-like protein